jgi:hypothetical protein
LRAAPTRRRVPVRERELTIWRSAIIAGNSHGRTISVAIVADVMRLLASDADAGAEAGPANAEAVKLVSPNSGFVLATTAAQTVRGASNNIALDACAGDTVRFHAKSGSNNFEAALLIEDISPISDHDSLQGFALLNVERSAVTPHDNASVFPARSPEQDFWFWQCVVATDGEPHCSILLAAYDRDEQGRPRFAGHYRWDLQFTVKLTSPPPAVPTKERRHE